jgi:hypothetical protein
METNETKTHSNLHKIETDFAYLWLGKFAQSVLAILPGIFFAYFTPGIFQSAFLTIVAFAVTVSFSYLINFALGKKFYDKKETVFSRYTAYILVFATINILNLNGVSSLCSNLGLLALICFQSIELKNFKFPLFAFSLSYLTALFYSVLPASSKFAANASDLKTAELISLTAIFAIATIALFRLISNNNNIFLSLEQAPEETRVRSTDHYIVNLSISSNALIYSVFFGSVFAGTNLHSWGVALLIFSFLYLLIGFLYFDRKSRHNHAQYWFALFGVLSFFAIAILANSFFTMIGWELVALILIILSRQKGMGKIKTLGIVISQAVFGYFIISEALGHYLDPSKIVSIGNIFFTAPLLYIISVFLKKSSGEDSPLYSTLEAILLLMIAVSLVVSPNLISTIWALIGFSIVLIGFPTEDHSLNFGGLAVLFITLIKILVIDASGLPASAFILPVVIISPILIAVGTIYQNKRDTSFRPNVVVERFHVLGQNLAAERVNMLTDNLEKKYANLFHSPEKSWNESHDILSFSLVSFGFHISGKIEVHESTALLKVQLPMLAMVFKDQIVNSVDGEVGNLLEPNL